MQSNKAHFKMRERNVIWCVSSSADHLAAESDLEFGAVETTGRRDYFSTRQGNSG